MFIFVLSAVNSPLLFLTLFLWSVFFLMSLAAAAAKSLQSCPTLCDPINGSPPGFPVPGILQARTQKWVAISSPMHESEKWKWHHSVVSNCSRPHGLQPTRLPRPCDFPGTSTGVGCHCLLQTSLAKGLLIFFYLSKNKVLDFISLFYCFLISTLCIYFSDLYCFRPSSDFWLYLFLLLMHLDGTLLLFSL